MKQTIHGELDTVREYCFTKTSDLSMEFEVEGAIAEGEEPSITAEAEREATSVLKALQEHRTRDQRGGIDTQVLGSDDWAPEPEDYDPEDFDGEQHSDDGLGIDRVETGSCGAATTAKDLRTHEVIAVEALPQKCGVASEPQNSNATAIAELPESGELPNSTFKGKPLVDPPEFGDRVRDTDKVPYWIPGAFPTIFQNETGDPYNYEDTEVDLVTWGPHVMRSKGWFAQAHMTFLYWWLNMIQRMQALSAKKWYVRDNPKATGYTVDDLCDMNVGQTGTTS